MIRSDWEDVKTDIMYKLVRDKFTRTEPFESQAKLKRMLRSEKNRIEFCFDMLIRRLFCVKHGRWLLSWQAIELAV